MPCSCCVPLCTNHGGKKLEGISYHSFPSDPILRRTWLIKIRRDIGPKFQLTEHTKVCSAHFVETDFKPKPLLSKSSMKCLKENVVPSIFQWTSEGKGKVAKAVVMRASSRKLLGFQNKLSNDAADAAAENNEEPSTSDQADKKRKKQAEKDPGKPTEKKRKPSERNQRKPAAKNQEKTAEKNERKPAEKNQRKSAEKNQRKPAEKKQKPAAKIKQQRKLGMRTSLGEMLALNELKEVKNAAEINKAQLEAKINFLEAKLAKLNSSLLRYENIRNSKKLMHFYTGLPDRSSFDGLLEFLREKADKLTYFRGAATQRLKLTRFKVYRELNLENILLLVLLRLRQGIPQMELARIFGISQPLVSLIFTTWINFMSVEFKQRFAIPDIASIRKTTPPQFSEYPDTTLMLHCCEVRVQKPFKLSAHLDPCSSYKHGETFKFLVGITPGGLMCAVSPLYGESVSDNDVVKDSGFLDLLTPGHSLMTGEGLGFGVEKLLPPGVTVIVLPKNVRQEGRMLKNEAKKTREVNTIRVHAERAVRRIKVFRILNGCLPSNLRDIAGQIVSVCAYLTNFKTPFVSNARRANEVMEGKNMNDNVENNMET